MHTTSSSWRSSWNKLPSILTFFRFSAFKSLPPKMESMASLMPILLYIAVLIAACSSSSSEAAAPATSFEDNFDIMWSENHFKTSADGEIWYLSLDEETGKHEQDLSATKIDFCSILMCQSYLRICISFNTTWNFASNHITFFSWFLCNWIGCGFQTKQKYRFGWFSMKLKLVGGDSAGVVTAYYVSL